MLWLSVSFHYLCIRNSYESVSKATPSYLFIQSTPNRQLFQCEAYCLYCRFDHLSCYANIVLAVKTCYKIKINYRESKSCFYGFFQHQSHSRWPSKSHIDLIVPLLQSKSVTIARQYLNYWAVKVALWHLKSASFTPRLFMHFCRKAHN